MDTILVGRKSLTLSTLRRIAREGPPIALDPACIPGLDAGVAAIERIVAAGEPAYGINTGFGKLAQSKISRDDLSKMQTNLVLSHAAGTGPLLADEAVRLILVLKIASLAKGHSGVHAETVNALVALYTSGAYPCIPSKGSVGASGDLAPLAHMVLPLLGLGEMDYRGKRLSAATVLRKLGLKPLRLQSKEGLGLINGTQFMSAYAVHCLLRIDNLARTADIAAAMTLEAARGSAAPYDARIHAARPHSGQQVVAKNLRALLKGSKILPSHAHCAKVQDPYSLRCVPQVHGAVRLAIEHARSVVETEINSATDNPLVFANGDVISGGNFHGEPLAFVLDYLAIATAELASIAERRIYMLLHGDTIGDLKVPRLLMKDTGLNSGFMIPQYTAAALVSENKIFAHPASVDSIPSSLGQEDHVSMGSISATKLLEVVKNTETVLAIEFMCSAQGLEFLRPLKSGPGVEAAFSVVRRHIPFAQADRLFHNDVQTALALVRSEQLAAAAQRAAGKLA